MKLIAEEGLQTLFTDLELIHKKLNGYIKSIGRKNEPVTNDQCLTKETQWK